MSESKYTTLRIDKNLLQELRLAKAKITSQMNGEKLSNSDIIKIAICLIKDNPESATNYLRTDRY